MNGGLANAIAITNQPTNFYAIFDYLAGSVLRITFVQYLITFHSQPEEMSEVISSRFLRPMVPDNRVKFGGPRLNHSLEIPLKPPEAAFSTVFTLWLPTGSRK